MARFPHDRYATALNDIVVEPLRAFHFGDHQRAGITPEHVAGKDHEQFVAPKYVTLLVDGADPVSVAVIGDTDIGFFFSDLIDQQRQIFRHRRVWMMEREIAIGNASKLPHLAAQVAENRRGYRAADAASGIDNDI